MTRIYSIIGTLAVFTGLTIGGWIAWTARPFDPFADCRTSQIAGIGKIGGEFTLTDQNGTVLTDRQVIDSLALVYFGYAYCPDICPLDTTRNAEVSRLLASREITLKPVFITIDPERDTPEILDEFVAGIDPGIVALTGTPAEIAAVAKSYGVYFAKSGDDEFYLMEHTVQSYLMHPEYGFLEFYPRELRASQIADSVACFAQLL